MCPTYKYLEFENINDIEYCVLEAIAMSRYNGSYTAGDDGLAKKFNLSSKQLHYSLIMLEGHDLIKKQVLKSEKMRSIIYLKRYAFKNKTLVENVSEFLMSKGLAKDPEFNYTDTFVNIKKKFSFSNKQFKTLVHNGERLGVFKRFMTSLRTEVIQFLILLCLLSVKICYIPWISINNDYYIVFQQIKIISKITDKIDKIL